MRQPPGLFLLFAVEMWERFSYYGMRAILVLFLVDTRGGGLRLVAGESASRLYGFYGFCAYGFPLLGGYLADRLLGTHRALVLGSFIIAAGHFCLAVPAIPTFFVGLALVAIGTGFFKPTSSTMVGQLYKQGDARRDGGFTIFYMGVNLGALLGPDRLRLLRREPALGLALRVRRRRGRHAAAGWVSTCACGASTWRGSARSRAARELAAAEHARRRRAAVARRAPTGCTRAC